MFAISSMLDDPNAMIGKILAKVLEEDDTGLPSNPCRPCITGASIIGCAGWTAREKRTANTGILGEATGGFSSAVFDVAEASGELFAFRR